MALRGLYHINMDAKGRLALPAKIRERLPEKEGLTMPLVATIDLRSKCLVAYSEEDWENIEEQILKLKGVEDAVRKFQKIFVGHAHDISVDANGRILVPPSLREYAGLEKKIVLVGQLQRLEIWDESLWIEERDRLLESVSSGELELTDELMSLPI